MSDTVFGGYSLSFTVTEENADVRIDRAVADAFPDFSRSRIQKMAENGCISVNGKTVSKSFKPKTDDEVIVYVEPAEDDTAQPENIPLDIRYEDDCLLVVNKPKGMVVHPAPGNRHSTLVNALLYHCKGSLSGINGVLRPGIVHRIDKDTSGLLLVAKNDFAHVSLAQQIKEHSLTREYAAVVHGRLKEPEGTVSAPIGRNPNDRKKMAVVNVNSKPAVTHFYVVEEFPQFTYVRLRLETGRTHQIRVHMAYIGHPVAGDAVYGSQKNCISSLNGQCLHARLLGFTHPVTGERIEISSELPPYFEDFLRRIDK
ncbi:MAG: RluA family pseudouridine synthase [Clostridia bacterium]|nr:RluA family pseudouridine synthase [Clostridia bacterium]